MGCNNACTDVGAPYAGCTLAACTAVDTPYAGCTLAACTSVDTPYAGCTVTGKCTGNTGATGDVDCSTEATNTVNKGATVTGSDAAACCEAPATNTGSESLSPSARAMKEEASRFEKAKAIARKAVEEATIVGVLLGLMALGLLTLFLTSHCCHKKKPQLRSNDIEQATE